MIGPDRIDPGGAPGGIVFHVYAWTGELVATSACVPPMTPAMLEADAEYTADLATARTAGPVALVAYDGDTGVRLLIGFTLEAP